MKKVDMFIEKWKNSSIKKIESPFDIQQFSPEKFLVRVHDCGSTGCCSFSSDATAYFESEKEALAFYRHFEIARILDYDSGTMGRTNVPVEQYLPHYEPEFQKVIQELLELLDQGLNARKVSKRLLNSIQEKYNSAFSDTNPINEILAWGKLPEFLQSDCFKEFFLKFKEDPSLRKHTVKLEKLLTAGTFDLDDMDHFELAARFLMNCERY